MRNYRQISDNEESTITQMSYFNAIKVIYGILYMQIHNRMITTAKIQIGRLRSVAET